jgi:hypothetical protein
MENEINTTRLYACYVKEDSSSEYTILHQPPKKGCGEGGILYEF